MKPTLPRPRKSGDIMQKDISLCLVHGRKSFDLDIVFDIQKPTIVENIKKTDKIAIQSFTVPRARK